MSETMTWFAPDRTAADPAELPTLAPAGPPAVASAAPVLSVGSPATARLLLADAWLSLVGPAVPAGGPGAGLTESAIAHLARLGPRPPGTRALVDLVERVGLTGHGGAHGPVALKWRAVLRGTGPLTLVANGAESEPVSAKDGTLMRQRPHLVLDGMALAAEALGARRVVVWLHGDDDGARAAIEHALAERRHLPGADLPVEVVSGPSHYLSGESNAIARAIAGGPALPTLRRFPGPGEPSTVVQNVETLARLALVARGLVPTTVLATVLTPTGRRVVEVERTVRVADLLTGVGWSLGPPPQAVLVGGYGGTWIAWSQVADLRMDPEDFRAAGFALGAGVVVPLPPGACGVTETAAMTAYLASMSAHQCGPCLFGLPALAGSLELLASGRAPAGELARLHADVRAVEGRGACRHPDGATRLIASAVGVFADHLADHAEGRPCQSVPRSVFPMPQEQR